LAQIVLASSPAAPAEETETADKEAESRAEELDLWETIKPSENPADFQTYIQSHPFGEFVELARIRMLTLKHSPGKPSKSLIEAQPAKQPTLPAEAAKEDTDIAPSPVIASDAQLQLNAMIQDAERLAREGDARRALRAARNAQAFAERNFAADSLDGAQASLLIAQALTTIDYSNLLAMSGKVTGQEARGLLNRVIATRERELGPNDGAVAEALIALGRHESSFAEYRWGSPGWYGVHNKKPTHGNARGMFPRRT